MPNKAEAVRVAGSDRAPSLMLVIAASSAGSLIEWHDFYVYASMTVYLGRLFMPQDPRQGMLGFALATFGTGFAILLSGVLAAVSLWFRLRLQETPAFQALQRSHRQARMPVRELFSTWPNLRLLLLAVFGSTAGQAALGSVALNITPSDMQAILHVDVGLAASVALVAVLPALPFHVASGWLCDGSAAGRC